uniref:Uncharacterized protein n=1 Tax=Guillardia theta TaxID=55529 RepID=A0A7S4N412_GUITH|mmetsp:Transcript_16531/g.55175  ORF Transcript_16531/g.55175 Transcript_16531/m.55175 type:complete len:196 (+) Transcript_16531:206-793(+)
MSVEEISHAMEDKEEQMDLQDGTRWPSVNDVGGKNEPEGEVDGGQSKKRSLQRSESSRRESTKSLQRDRLKRNAQLFNNKTAMLCYAQDCQPKTITANARVERKRFKFLPRLTEFLRGRSDEERVEAMETEGLEHEEMAFSSSSPFRTPMLGPLKSWTSRKKSESDIAAPPTSSEVTATGGLLKKSSKPFYLLSN